MPTLILLNFLVHQGPESVMMNQTVHKFLDFLILFLPHQSNVMDHSGVLVINYIYKNKEPCLYVHKKTSKRISRSSNLSLSK